MQFLKHNDFVMADLKYRNFDLNKNSAKKRKNCYPLTQILF